MAEPGRSAQQLFFLDSDRHPLLASAEVPVDAQPRHGILICPAFADEMNRTRRTIRLFMQQASRLGLATINVDLRGTGDSAGDFADASWEDWLADLAAASQWLRRQGCVEISLLGVRSGALLAWQLAGAGIERFSRIVLWQPILTGAAVITDLLRARAIAAGPGSGREGVSAARERLRNGLSVEAAGYTLTAQLARTLGDARIAATGNPDHCPVGWLEIVAGPDAFVRPVAEQTALALRAAGTPAAVLRVQDPPFWATTEITTGEATIAASLRWLSESQ